MIARTTSPRRARHPHGELRERVGNYLSVKPPKVGNSLSADRFRPGRGGHDAIEAIFTTACGKNAKRLWALDADLHAAFDQIAHDQLLRQIGTFPARGLIAQWLKAGVVEQGRFTPTERGTPQGGIASPLLLNVALHGMEQAAGVRYYTDADGNPVEAVRNVPIVVRYADDLLALCHSKDQAEQVKARLSTWLAPRGLVFNEDKTRITPLTLGCDFLGFGIRRYRNGKLLIKPSHAAVKRIRKRLAEEMRTLRGGQRLGGHRTAQPDHPGLGLLLPDRGVGQGVQRAGQLRVEPHLPVGATPAPQQTQDLGRGPVLRHVQHHQEGPMGLRRPRQRRLPDQVFLDSDRPPQPGQGHGVPGRPCPGRLLVAPASQT